MRPEAVEAMLPYLTDSYGNPSGAHAMARAARDAIDDVRVVMADALGCRPGEIVFTSGGTESDNTAVFGFADRGHGRVLRHRAPRRARSRCTVVGGRVVGVDADGVIDLDALAAALDDDGRARVGDARQQRDRHDPAAGRRRRGRSRPRAAGGAAHRRGAGASRGSTSPRWPRPPTWSRSAPTSSAVRRASACSSCATASTSPPVRSAAARSASAAAARRTSPASSPWASRRGSRSRSARRPSTGSSRCAIASPTGCSPSIDGALRERRPRAQDRRQLPRVLRRHRERGAAVPARAGGDHGVGRVVVRERRAGSVARARGHRAVRVRSPVGRCGCRSARRRPTTTSIARSTCCPTRSARLRLLGS